MKIPFFFSFFPFFFAFMHQRCRWLHKEKEEHTRSWNRDASKGGCKGGCRVNAWILTLGGHSVFHPLAFLSPFPAISFFLILPPLSLSLCITACAYIYIHIYLSPLFPLADIISTTGPASVHLVPYYCISRDICERSCRLRANYECYACNSLSGRESGRL